MQSIIHHMHSGSGDSSDEHGCETHFIKTGVAVLDHSYGVGVVQIFEVRGGGGRFVCGEGRAGRRAEREAGGREERSKWASEF